MSSKPGKIIKNVATLDLRSASAETLAGIERIGNVATLIYSTENADQVTSLNIGNVASMIKLPHDAQLLTGQEELGPESFSGLTEPLDLFVTGQLIIKPNIPLEELRKGLNSLYITGQLLYPESLGSVIKSKLREVSGQAVVYSDEAKFVMGKLTLTDNYLRSLDDATSLLVFGRMEATEPVSNELLVQKIKQIDVMGRLTCREENAEVLIPRVKDASRITIIPSGYFYLAQPLTLDSNLIDALPGRQLYGANLTIDKDISAEAFDSAIDALTITDLLIAPAALRQVVSKKCNLFETTTVFYEDELWLIENESTIYADRFDYVEGKVTLVVRGELLIDAAVEPKTLAAQIAKVHNWGEIHCSKAQMSALQARLGTDHGEFVNSSMTEAKEEEEAVIGNAAYLVL